MTSRRRLVAGLAVVASLVSTALAAAAEHRPFDRAAFEAAQAQGRPILVDVYADWCPTCRAQAPVVSRATQAPQHAQLLVLKLNYDKQKADWRRLGVRRQSTLIAFKGRAETGRSVGETDPAAISRLLAATVR